MRKPLPDEMQRRPTYSTVSFEERRDEKGRMTHDCRVYWGSHGCDLERGHAGEHICGCSVEEGVDGGALLPHMDDADAAEDSGNVGRAPYYGPDTNFYGEDAEDADIGRKG